jgi:D-3-phosphoglycerate dehydrogenase
MTVLLLEPIHEEALERLSSEFTVRLVEDPDEAASLARREDLHAIITRGKGQVRRPLIEACPRLRVIARVGVGLDNIDVEAASEHGVRVINAPGSTTRAVAEHTVLLMLCLVRQLYPLAGAVKAGNWSYRRTYLGEELSGKTLGLVGLGAIGERVAELASRFGMDVAYWSRSEKAVPYPRLALDELLATADIVSLHVALTPATRHLLDRSRLALLKPGALLVNTARGRVVDQDALIEALREGRIGGFASDVLDPEPPAADDPLIQLDNVLITPHTAALTASTFRDMSLRTISNVISALRGEPVEAGCLYNADALGVM